jgi:hypothetical protein
MCDLHTVVRASHLDEQVGNIARWITLNNASAMEARLCQSTCYLRYFSPQLCIGPLDVVGWAYKSDSRIIMIRTTVVNSSRNRTIRTRKSLTQSERIAPEICASHGKIERAMSKLAFA